MDDIITTLSLDFCQNRSLQTVNLKQFDNNTRIVKINLYNNGTAVPLTTSDGATAYAEIGGIATAVDKKCTIENGAVVLVFDSAMTGVAGLGHCDVKIKNARGQISTATFNLNVEKSVVSKNTTEIVSTADIFSRLELMDAERFDLLTEHTSDVHPNYTLKEFEVEIPTARADYSYTIAKSVYNTAKDGLCVWLNYQLLIDGADYVVVEAGETQNEIRLANGVNKNDLLTIQVWQQPASGGTTMPAIAVATARGTAEGIADIVEEDNE